MNNRAVLLVNLGSPDAPEVPAVRRYLRQFLMDPYVIQLPWPLRALIVYLLVLPRRPAASAAAYRSIWTEEGSPLLALSDKLLAALRKKRDMPMAVAMRYGNPGIEATLLKLAATPGIDEILFIPLYPHFADSTVTTSIKEAQRVIDQHGLKLNLLTLRPFYDEPDYIDALVNSARPWLAKMGEKTGEKDHLVLSYHGLPEAQIKKADPTGSHCLRHPDCCYSPSPAHATCYRHQVFRTTDAFMQATGLDRERLTVAFQSRLGRAKWLEPSTADTLTELGNRGVENVYVICPAFVTDCLETLEEIEIQGRETFLAAGGKSLTLIPCLNDHPDWVTALSRWIDDYPERFS